MLDNLVSGRSLDCPLSSPSQVIDGGLVTPGSRQVMRHPLRLRFDRLRKLLLQNICNTAMELLAFAAEQALIGCVLHEGVLEDVFGIGGFATTINQFGSRKLLESTPQ